MLSPAPRGATSCYRGALRKSSVYRPRRFNLKRYDMTPVLPRSSDWPGPILDQPPAALSDEELRLRFAAGQREAGDELFRRYQPDAYRVAFQLLGNEADAQDAVQEGLLNALANLASFEGRGSFEAWLVRVVRNAALDVRRQRCQREAVSLDGQLPLADPRDLRAGIEWREILAQFKARAKPDDFDTWGLVAVEGYSQREAAAQLGCDEKTVYNRLKTARSLLWRLLGETPPADAVSGRDRRDRRAGTS